MALLGWKFLRGIKIQHFKELFHMVFLFKLFLLKKKKSQTNNTQTFPSSNNGFFKEKCRESD